jgi:hypothetical protein
MRHKTLRKVDVSKIEASVIECFVRGNKAEVYYPIIEDLDSANEHFSKMIPATDEIDASLYPVYVFFNQGMPVAWNDTEDCCGFIS